MKNTVKELQLIQSDLHSLVAKIDNAINYIEVLEGHHARLKSQLEFYEQNFGTYEDVQAQAKAPIIELVDAPFDDAEYIEHALKTGDFDGLTDEQKHAYYLSQQENNY